MKRNPTRALAIAAGVVIIALTAAAFWLSYAHLAEVALGHGLGNAPERAWAWPACLDLFIMAGEIMWLRAALAHRVDWWAIVLTFVGSGGSIALNVAGVGTAADPLNYVVAAIPPTAALLAFGALMRQVHQALAGHTEPVEVTTFHPEVVPVPGPRSVVMRPLTTLPPAPYRWEDVARPELTTKATTTLPAHPARQVVTEAVTLTPAELRRQGRRLNRDAVRSTRRPVTIQALQTELGLSRRDAAELRREIVKEGGQS
ncbi:DUF2637 domain-containing protein [Streptomyces sp. PA03-6a]|nr:DUF2637 domain-containing protein [Streptomyces sp. PA03-6a]